MLYSTPENSIHFSNVGMQNSYDSDNIFSEFQYYPRYQIVNTPYSIEENYNKIRHIFNTLKPHGYEPKIFSKISNPQSPNTEIKSSFVTWCVEPLTSENLKKIPHKFIQAYGLLVANNISVDGIAIAHPKPIENKHEIFGQEMFILLRSIQNIGIFFVKLMLTCYKSTTNKKTTPVKTIPATTFTTPPDPVLLVKIEDVYLEIGRWE